jgi:arylsulfatase B
MSAMVTELDKGVGQVVAALTRTSMLNDTVIIFTTDNGGPLEHSYNFPLRGGKHTFWEGGVRGEAFIWSSLIPESLRGTKYHGLAHTSDWLPTIVSGIYGLPTSLFATPSDLRPVDGVNLWPSILDGNKGVRSPRTEVIHQVNADGPLLRL